MKIFKYKIHDIVEIPAGSMILDVALQDSVLFLWALVDPRVDETDSYQFKVVRTGRELDFNVVEWVYAKTVQSSFKVWHVWYKRIS